MVVSGSEYGHFLVRVVVVEMLVRAVVVLCRHRNDYWFLGNCPPHKNDVIHATPCDRKWRWRWAWRRCCHWKR